MACISLFNVLLFIAIEPVPSAHIPIGPVVEIEAPISFITVPPLDAYIPLSRGATFELLIAVLPESVAVIP